MLGMDGLEVARRLRTDLGLMQTLLVALTGYGEESDLPRSQEAGCNAHLMKPAQPLDLACLRARPVDRRTRDRPGSYHSWGVPGEEGDVREHMRILP